MQRFPISRLMLLVALLAGNCAAIRLLLAPGADLKKEMLAGLIPLADVLLLLLAAVAARYRIAWRRRGERRDFALCGLVLSAAFLAAAAVACRLAPGPISDYIEAAGRPVDRALRALGVDTLTDTPLVRYVLLPAFLGAVLSGPPLAACLPLAFVLCRFRLVVTPHAEEPCVATASSP